MNRVREWLLRNKVFFEVGAAVLIGGTSLVVSWAALRVSERTLTATQVAALPHFALSKRARYDANTSKFIEETLVLNNHGAPVFNLSWNVRTFLVFERFRPSAARTYVPLVAYYFAQYPTASPTGELSSIVGHENLRKFAKLYAEALDGKNIDPDYSAVPSQVTFSVVTYEDRLGRKERAYFRDYTKVEESVAKPFFDLSAKTRGVDIDSVSLKDALAFCRTNEALTIEGR